eukprot:TRINITY_DN2386_c0_g1_i1.p1 TRINITY_DN2386_c0_g1~~TRINITY_DN2386_c0_g1_i1.p1  ORF type:complete len:393 (+),score=63.63 TRINITY_DN2386_c0_g1_i1:273-1451(+)
MSSESQDWKFCQVFGDRSPVEEVSDVDIVSAVEFNETGDYIATGDRGGRVVIFERCQDKDVKSKKKEPKAPEYKFFVEFQSHEPEFDYLKSLEIEEKINKIKWLNRTSGGHHLLTTNDKTIKLWRVHEKKVKQVMSTNIPVSNGVFSRAPPPISALKIPKIQTRESIVTAQARRVYANAHAYHINSISVNSDGETYISSDDLRINLWNLAVSDQSFNIVDIKPANMEELTEVITSAEFHPQQCNVFMYSSSKGTIKLADMRQSALCDNYSKVFEEEEDPANKSFFSEIISSISDIKFSRDGRYILSRDYLTLKLWDINMESKPVKSIPIHDYLRSKLCDLYENDCIFDKFECTMSGDGSQLLTGSYHNYFHIYDKNTKNDVCIEASKYAQKN